MSTNESCVICSKESTYKCGRCLGPAYCSKEHQKLHWKTHKANCNVYRVEKNAKLGRFLVASRDIQPGEVILKDDPLVLGPRQVTIPLCLGCSSPVDGSYSCSMCGWPMCGPQCEKLAFHKPECEYSQRRNPKIKISKFGQINQMYECITPLRCLWMKDNAKHRWNTLMEMESHLNERKSSEICPVVQTNVVDFAKIYLKVEEFTNEQFHTVCGIIDVNGFEIPGPDIIGLYGKACLLENCCVPNTSRSFDEQLSIIIRATTLIKKDEHITTCYSDTMWGTNNRNLLLNTSKYFQCNCYRCLDPTELGTHLSSLKCISCCEGLAVPSSIKDDEVWTCNKCGFVVQRQDVEELLTKLGRELITLKGNIASSELFLKNTQHILSENHYYRNDVKLALAQLYGNQGLQLSSATDNMLQRKQSLCEDLLNVIKIVSPGPVRLRGILQYELQRTFVQMYKKMPKKQKTSPSAKNLLQAAVKSLEDAINILCLESPLQEDYRTAMSGKNELVQLRQHLSKFK